MRYGYHMGFGPIIMMIILIIAVITLLIVVMGGRKNSSTQIQAPLDALRVRYAKGEICAEEYREKKSFIEKERNPDQATIILMQRYVNGEISQEEYAKIKKEIS